MNGSCSSSNPRSAPNPNPNPAPVPNPAPKPVPNPSPTPVPPPRTDPSTAKLDALASCKKAQDPSYCAEWLVAHNDRRYDFHKEHGKTPSLLTWDTGLAQDAQDWVDKLVADGSSSCFPANDPDGREQGQGQNNYANAGNGSNSAPHSPERIMESWWDQESQLVKQGQASTLNSWDVAGFSQAAWYETSKIGCAVASKPIGNGLQCNISNCRYYEAGNCNISDRSGKLVDDWEDKVMNGQSCFRGSNPSPVPPPKPAQIGRAHV